MGQHRAKIGPRWAKMGPRWDNIGLRCREEKNEAKMTQKKPNHHGRDVFPLLRAGGRRQGAASLSLSEKGNNAVAGHGQDGAYAISIDISFDISSDISSDILSDIFSDIFLTHLLTYLLAAEVRRCPARSGAPRLGSGIAQPAVQSTLELSVKVRHCPVRFGASY